MTRRPAPVAALGLLLFAAACGPRETGEPLPPAAAVEELRAALALADPLERHLRTAALLRRAPPEALPGLREAFDAAPLDLGDPELVSFGVWWAGFDPEGASGWAVADWRAAHFPVIKNVFEVWAYSDPGFAYKRVFGVPAELREGAMRGVLAGWQRSGRPGLVEQVRSIANERDRQQMAETLARRLVIDRGVESAIEWADGIADPAFRRIMQLRIASAGVQLGDPETVTSWAEPRVSRGEERTTGLPRRIATRWVRRDPEATFAWLEGLPPGKDRDDGVMEAYRDWWQWDREAAHAWAERTELERWNEPAFSIYLRRLGFEEPEAALADIMRFENEAERNRFTLIVAQRWIDRDPEAAGAWLAAHAAEINGLERERLSERLEKRLRERVGEGG